MKLLEKHKYYLISAAAASLLLLAGLYTANYFHGISPVSRITKQAGFSIFIPQGAQEDISFTSSIAFDANAKVVNYIYKIPDHSGNRITVSQQETPESFIDVPEVYSKLLTSLRPYKTFNTELGTVTLTKPVELKGGQSAVLNAKGVLLFARPSKDMTDEQWKTFIRSLKI